MRVRLKAERLRKRLATSRLSQNAWARRLGLNKGHLSQLVNGRRPYPSPETRQRLLDGLSLEFDELFEVEDATQYNRRLRWRRHFSNEFARRKTNMTTLFWRDFKYSLRTLFRTPGFLATSVLILALGMGAATAIYSIVDNVLLDPLSYYAPERIVRIYQQTPLGRDAVSAANLRDIRHWSNSFEVLAVAEPRSVDLLGGPEPYLIPGALVSEGFFKVWGVNPHLGRTFLPEEYREGSEGSRDVAILGYGHWQRLFGGDESVLRRDVEIDGRPVRIVGIMPADFRPALFFPEDRSLWLPRAFSETDDRRRGANYLESVGRLKPGVSLETANEELAVLSQRLREDFPVANAEMSMTGVTVSEALVSEVRPALVLLLGGVGLLLLITCANVANLFLLRQLRRRQQFGIQMALGASRYQVIRQLLSESLLISVSASALGLVVAWTLIQVLHSFNPEMLPRMTEIGIDGTVLLFAALLALVLSLLAGIVPAIQVSGIDPNRSLREGGRGGTQGRSSRRLRQAFVVVETSLAVVLLSSALLLAQNLIRGMHLDAGFEYQQVAALQVHAWDRNDSDEARVAFFQQTLERIRALPGVVSAAAASAVPFYQGSIMVDTGFQIVGEPADESSPQIEITAVTEGYFEVLQQSVVQGRPLRAADPSNSVVEGVLNATMAQRFWLQQDPVGSEILLPGYHRMRLRIVGVVADVLRSPYQQVNRPELYIPHSAVASGSMVYVFRTRGEPAASMQAVKQAVWSVDPLQTFHEPGPLTGLLSEALSARRLAVVAIGFFACIALILAVLGIYGVVSYGWLQRRREIGVRLALGARPGEITRMVLGEGGRLALLGIVLGAGLTLLAMRVMANRIQAFEAGDPTALVLAGAGLLAVALWASYLPGRRAANLNVTEVLKSP